MSTTTHWCSKDKLEHEGIEYLVCQRQHIDTNGVVYKTEYMIFSDDKPVNPDISVKLSAEELSIIERSSIEYERMVQALEAATFMSNS